MLLSIAAVLVIASALLIPLLPATSIAPGLNPIVAGLARPQVPRMPGMPVADAGAGLAMVGAVHVLRKPAADWIRQAPVLLRDVGYKRHRMTWPLTRVGHAASQSLEGIGVGTSSVPPPQAVTPSFGNAPHAALRMPADMPPLVLLVFLFMTCGDEMRARLVRGIQMKISPCLPSVMLINGCLGALTTLILWTWKMPDPVL